MSQVACALTIAGTDPSGGAGIQADLKTFQELKSYGMSVITSVVAQNTTGVGAIHHVPLDIIKEQLDSVLSDMPIDAFKTGMIANIDMMKLIAEKITSIQKPYIMDPVMVATSGDALIEEKARDYLRENLLPLTTLVTPNLSEAAFLIEEKITNIDEMKQAAVKIVDDLGAGAVLIKGGHLEGEATDVLYDGDSFHSFTVKRIPTKNTHGTGCTYSAAITAYLSQGMTLYQAVEKAKHFVTAAIKYSFPLGSGNGPTNHFALREEETVK
ncbi:bifunctional hydroxymethylpyrimidine kinase/phosphomethylpyrimidine kinase [Oceanobacillus piezotolerans]|uniref:Hydroxymethylpyrimidine/phosphomethylpyrimidine kinase n=1 Tax=Oceanobacillus piezotolerans TaxID=2448030 RepID=A0A498D3I0_9BACI|nr:bifunctional hydroxymethylpyrimidine kinase/phosphomethylpyrimidine kinase [Oceanobacillus piezotolerans]RLL42020.1 bifunctional hydroxymethylpyrimidine kinase/phosphomethylpyrimidine kinase [Oceanobacillus piezotolerans]